PFESDFVRIAAYRIAHQAPQSFAEPGESVVGAAEAVIVSLAVHYQDGARADQVAEASPAGPVDHLRRRSPLSAFPLTFRRMRLERRDRGLGRHQADRQRNSVNPVTDLLLIAPKRADALVH